MWRALARGDAAGLAASLAATAQRLLPRALAANAFTHPPAAAAAVAALPPAAHPGSLLPGVPVAVKANIAAVGTVTSAGSRMLADYHAPYDATAVARLRRAGAAVVGATNQDEFGMGSATASSYYGPTLNPAAWPPSASSAELRVDGQPRLTPGGSSGGSAAAVASGVVPIALGSDTGGSVRQPAAFCGVVGLKPTYGRVPRWGLVAYASSLDTIGVLAGCVDDAAMTLDIIAGCDGHDDTALREEAWGTAPPTGGAPLWSHHVMDALAGCDGAVFTSTMLAAAAADPATSYAHLRHPPLSPAAPSSVEEHIHGAASLSGLRVGVPREYVVAELPPQVRACWQQAAAALAGAGADVVSVSLPHTAHAVPAYYVIACAEAASNLARYDGVRYGLRADGAACAAAAAQYGDVPAAALHAMYAATRAAGFGEEVQRRLLMGNMVLSRASRVGGVPAHRYYEAAVAIRRLVTADFHAAFRPRQTLADGSTWRSGWNRGADGAVNAWLAAQSAAGAAGAGAGVDVLLTPTAPTLPWHQKEANVALVDDVGEGGSDDPAVRYMADIMTVPASLAGLPALSLPVALARAGSPPMLPMGLQLVGRWGDEDTLLRVAGTLERLCGPPPPRHRG